MSAAIVVLSALLTAELVFAPINLWTGQATPNFVRFTGFPPRAATHLLCPAPQGSPDSRSSPH